MNDLDERIRQHAYEIWESEGRPEGRDEEHWLRAREQIEVLTGTSGTETAQRDSLQGSWINPVEPTSRSRLKRGIGSSGTTSARAPRGEVESSGAAGKPNGRSTNGAAEPQGNIPSELGGARGKAVNSPLTAKYRHPQDPGLTWSGRGRRPDWIREVVEAGRALSDFEIGA